MKTRSKNYPLLLLVVICLSLMQAMPAQTAGSGIVYLPIVESRDQGVIKKYAEIEPNDSKEQANRIFTNQVYSGRAEDESDYYIFTMGQSGPVTITLNNAPVGAQMLLSTTPMTVVNGAPYVIYKPSLEAGAYTLKIFTPLQNVNSSWIYTFQVVTNNNPPDVPSNPSPTNGVTVQSLEPQLSWMGSDTDGDAVTYDVYFGMDNPPVTQVSNDQTSLSYDPGFLTAGANYYWKVVAKDEHGLETISPVWQFMTYDPVAGMVYVPAGNFLRGCVAGHNGGFVCNDSELPSATVYLDAFYIDKYEVTNDQYAQCVAAGGCTAPSSNSSSTHASYYGNTTYNNYPVIYVNWSQATAYCAWMGKRLPTEAEWEKAARGTEGLAFPWGDLSVDCTLANYDYLNSCKRDTTAVGNYPAGASPYGALDMAGNVWEWVSDWYSGLYYSVSPSSNPTGPGGGNYRVIRGGSWTYFNSFTRSASRHDFLPSNNSNDVGFRCAANP